MTPEARWQWQAFDDHFGSVEARVLASAGAVQRSDEFYFVSPWTDLSVKIRDGALEVDMLAHTDASGLEHWRPGIKAAFPIEASVVATLLVCWQIDDVPISDRSLSQIDLLSLISDVAPEVMIIPVTQVWRTAQIGGCVVESVDVLAEGRQLHSMIVNGLDLAQVSRVVRDLGLDQHENLNTVSALRRVHSTPFVPLQAAALELSSSMHG